MDATTAGGPQQHEPIRITPDEVAAAVPPPRPRAPGGPSPPPPAPPAQRMSQLAVASLVVAALGVPLVGCLLGPVAVLLGALGLAQVQSRVDRTGARLALAGVLLGLADTVGWSIAGYHLLGRPAPPAAGRSAVPTLLSEPASRVEIDEAPEQIRRALRANVWVSSEGAAGAVQGSGILVAKGGERVLVLTNRHVVCAEGDAPGRVQVRLCDGVEAPGRAVWLAPDGIDAAIVEARCLASERVAPMPIEARVTVRIGDPAFAIGNPLAYEGTYTTGVISSIRSLRAGRRTLRVYQTQAPVNPGNSGGGLYTQEGQLIGVNTWATEKQVSEGLGFAIDAAALLGLLEAEEGALAREIAGGGR